MKNEKEFNEREFIEIKKGKLKAKIEITGKPSREVYEFYKQSLNDGFQIFPVKKFLEKNGKVAEIIVTKENCVAVGFSIIKMNYDGWKELPLKIGA